MSWANNYIKQLQEGKTISFRPRGNSMGPMIESGQLVTLDPIVDAHFSDLFMAIDVDDIVLCRVKGKQYLHLIKAIKIVKNETMFLIGNAKGYENGWITKDKIYGIVTKVEK